jgi:ABC-type multidrug transport system ATPase subunit
VAEAAVTALLQAERLHLRHDGADRDAVRDLSIAIERGEIVALVGPNGSGKSTLMACVLSADAMTTPSKDFSCLSSRRR